MSPKAILIISLAAFILAVAGLSVGGKDFLLGMEQADATVSFLDLARQATQKREYERADGYYKQALNFAEQTGNRAENVPLALGCYADFLRMKRNPLKDLKLAQSLDQRARELRDRTY